MTNPERDVVARLETMLASQMNRNELTCPGEHEYEPHCTHGNDHDPIVVGLRASVVAARALIERCEQAEQERESIRLELAASEHNRLADNEHLISERDRLKAENERLSVIVAQLQDFVTRERGLRDAIGKDGQQVNGYAPSITPSVLHTLERMIRDAPDVAANYARIETENNRLRAELDPHAAFERGLAIEARHEQDIEETYRRGYVDGYIDNGAFQAEAVARFMASRKGGSE